MGGKVSRIGGALFCLVVFILTFATATAMAQTTVFDNFGTGDTYDSSACYLAANLGVNWQYVFAFQFQPSASGYVSDIWLPVNLFEGDTANNLEIALMTDSGDQPGIVLETWTFNVSKTFSGTIVHGTGIGTTAISEGVTYWLAATVPSGTASAVAWCQNSIGDDEDYFTKESIGFAGPWVGPYYGNRAAFRIAVNNTPPQAVPSMTEWGMIIFMALAGLGAVYYLRRQRRAEN